MYKIPILDKSQNSITELLYGNNNRSREFNNIYRLSLNDELIKPLAYNSNSGVPVGTYSKIGLNNMSQNEMRKNIFSNNADPSEEMQQTEAEVRQYIQDTYNKLPPLTEKEPQIAPYINSPYSPELRNLMLQESIKQNTNTFFTESQDFVKEYQNSINSMYAEANMFAPRDNSTQVLSGLLQKQIELQNLNNMLLQKQMGYEEKKFNKYKNKMNMQQY
jgi:hypothetical protein